MLTRSLMMTLVLTMTARAEVIEIAVPSDDRWHYPFNFTPGFRAIGSCFGAADTPGFNDRDGYVVVAWDTSEQICPNLGPEAYDVQAMTVTLTNRAGADWPADTTVDGWFTYAVQSDPDPGRPLELFGAGFGPTHDAGTWVESSLYVGASGDAQVARDPFPFVFQDETGNVLHVEDSVTGLHNESVVPPLCDDPEGICPFTPIPWAVGVPIGYTPVEPFDVEFSINLALSDGEVTGYFREQLDAGRVVVTVTSMREAEQQGSQSGFPSFFMKEVLPLDPAARAAALSIDVVVHPSADFDGDGYVSLFDWTGLAECAGGPDTLPDPQGDIAEEECLCGFDFDRDGDVDLLDMGTFQTRFTGDG